MKSTTTEKREHLWELRNEEPPDHKRWREEKEKDLAEGLAGPFKRLWEASSMAVPPPVTLKKHWECSHCGAKVAAINEFADTAPSPRAILSTPLDLDYNAVLYPNAGKGSYVVLKRGKSTSRQYLDCSEFAVAAVHGR